MRHRAGLAVGAVLVALCGVPVSASAASGREIYVDPVIGNDSASGTASDPLRTVTAAWDLIPSGRELAVGVTINLAPGTYGASALPSYWEHRHGTVGAPILIRASGAARSAVLTGLVNMFDVSHLTLEGLSITPGSEAFHCEACSDVSITGSLLDGRNADGANRAQETVKVNQSDHINLTDNTITGSYGTTVDFVAVQHGVISGNNISNAEDWCAYVKGGSTDIVVRGNILHHCLTGGFTAGQGTGLEFMVAPWLTYEATEVTFSGNYIHDTGGAAFGVNGGANILIEGNSATNVGTNSHLVEVTFGGRSCDGDATKCAAALSAGGWGTNDVGGPPLSIPNSGVTVRSNTIVNPSGVASAWQHFSVPAPAPNFPGPARVGPDPARADVGLLITGNVIRNGGADMPLGLDGVSVCAPDNPTCTVAAVWANNDINGPGEVAVPTGLPSGTAASDPGAPPAAGGPTSPDTGGSTGSTPPGTGSAGTSVSVSAVNGGNKLRVDVDPDPGKGSWRFKVDRRTAKGSWKATSKTYRTKGAAEVRTLNLRRGTYRIRVLAVRGLVGSTSASIALKR